MIYEDNEDDDKKDVNESCTSIFLIVTTSCLVKPFFLAYSALLISLEDFSRHMKKILKKKGKKTNFSITSDGNWSLFAN